uniref:Ig-like domain-containing protein n=1 Tax=Callorhinchus milii TaxID=7868 RepID=A0A4W3GGA3_CALMI
VNPTYLKEDTVSHITYFIYLKKVNNNNNNKIPFIKRLSRQEDVPRRSESISVTAGDSATLECSFTGTPEIAATWFKNGTELMSGRKYKISVTHKVTSLKILTTEKADSAEYTCEVKNDVGSGSCQASVTVLGCGCI